MQPSADLQHSVLAIFRRYPSEICVCLFPQFPIQTTNQLPAHVALPDAIPAMLYDLAFEFSQHVLVSVDVALTLFRNCSPSVAVIDEEWLGNEDETTVFR